MRKTRIGDEAFEHLVDKVLLGDIDYDVCSNDLRLVNGVYNIIESVKPDIVVEDEKGTAEFSFYLGHPDVYGEEEPVVIVLYSYASGGEGDAWLCIASDPGAVKELDSVLRELAGVSILGGATTRQAR